MKNLIPSSSFAGAPYALPSFLWPSTKDTTSPKPIRRTTTANPFPSASGSNFTTDAKQQYFAGANTYWLGFQTNPSDVDLVLQNIAASSLKVLRIWGFNDVTSDPGPDTVYYQSFINGEAKSTPAPTACSASTTSSKAPKSTALSSSLTS
jgi:hypothetical protein